MAHRCHDDNPERVMQVKRLTAGAFLHLARSDCETFNGLVRAEFRDDPSLAVEVAHSFAELAATILWHNGQDPARFAAELITKVNTPAGEL